MTPQTFTYKYPRPSLTTDCVVFGFDGRKLHVLLIERGIEPYKGRWALPGGFVRMDETVEQCAGRELREETGLDIPPEHINQFGVFSDIHRDPRERVVTVAFYALIKFSEVVGGDDAAGAKWFPIDEVPALAFDHDKILSCAKQSLRRQIHFEPIGFQLLEKEFTMPQLLHLYEGILNVKFDRRNFYNKMLRYGLLDVKVPSNKPRNSTIYSFNEQNYHDLKDNGFMLEF